MPSILTRNPLADEESSGSARGMAVTSFQGLLGDEAGAAGELRELEDDELRRLDRSDTDLTHDHAGVDALGRVGLAVALDEERLVGRQPEQCTLAPLVHEEGADRTADARPQCRIVRLEHHPLRAEED